MLTRRLSARIAAATMAALIAVSAIAHAQPAPPPEGPRYIRSEKVNVRGGPGTGNSVIEVLLLGAEVHIYAITGDWARISPPGKPEKWVYAPLLQAEKPQPKPQKGKTPQTKAQPSKAQSAPEKAQAGPNTPSKPNQEEPARDQPPKPH